MIIALFTPVPQCVLRRLLLFVLFAKVCSADGACNRTEVKECYRGLLNSLVKEFTEQPFNTSRLDTLCVEYESKSRCAVHIAPCVDDDPTLGHSEILYATAREEACSDRNRNLFRTLIPNATCTVLPLLLSCVEEKLGEFRNEPRTSKSSCPKLETDIKDCVMSVGPPCPPNRHRLRYVRRTLTLLQEIQGCPYRGVMPGNDDREPDFIQGRCSYRQLRRCLDRQANLIPDALAGLQAKRKVSAEGLVGSICRRRRSQCHQHNKVDSCDAAEQDTIRRMEEAMDLAQTMLCGNNGTLLRNILFSYKSWNLHSFKECFTDDHVGSITGYLFAIPRLERDCRELRLRMYRCFNESYTLKTKEGDPKPDVSGAVKVLAVFLDRLTCVVSGDSPRDDAGGDQNRDGGDVDYPEDRTSYTRDEVRSVTTVAVRGKPSNDGAKFRLNTPLFLCMIAPLLQLVA